MARNKRSRFQSVGEMVRETVQPDEFGLADDLEQFSSSRKLVKELAILRSARGLTQEEMAEAMGHSQSYVSKLETSFDDDLSVGDLRKYLDALGLEFRAGAIKKGATLVDEVKQLCLAMRQKLHQVSSLARKDDGMVEHVAQFLAHVFVSVNTFLSEAADKLPRGHNNRPCISIECFEQIETMLESEANGRGNTRLPSSGAKSRENCGALN